MQLNKPIDLVSDLEAARSGRVRSGCSWRQFNRLSLLIARAKTRLMYKRFFGMFGNGSVIWSPVMLVGPENISIGARVSIRSGARLETVSERFGKTYRPKVVIGDDSTFEQNFHLACAESIVIGRKVAVTQNVGIFDIWHPFEDLNVPIVDQPLRTGPVCIGDETLIGMGAVIQPGVSIGRHCVIGANSVVTKSIPDFSIAVGTPAKVLKRFDHVQSKWVKC